MAIHDVAADLSADASSSASMYADWALAAGLDGNTAGASLLSEQDVGLAAALSGDASLTATLRKTRMVAAALSGDATVYANVSHFKLVKPLDFVAQRPPPRVQSSPAPTHHMLIKPPRRR